MLSAHNRSSDPNNNFLTMRLKNGFLLLSFTLANAALAQDTGRQPELRCNVTYASTTIQLRTTLQTDPYTVPETDIEGRFRFKAVMTGKPGKIDYIKLYAYLQKDQGDIPIHQASYTGPFAVSPQVYKLTPNNQLYAGELERILQYECDLYNPPQ